MIKEFLRVEVPQIAPNANIGQKDKLLLPYRNQAAQFAEELGFIKAEDLNLWVRSERRLSELPMHFIVREPYHYAYGGLIILTEHKIDLPVRDTNQLLEITRSLHAIYLAKLPVWKAYREAIESIDNFLAHFTNSSALVY